MNKKKLGVYGLSVLIVILIIFFFDFFKVFIEGEEGMGNLLVVYEVIILF